jgi:probable phosphoglycerate mutase
MKRVVLVRHGETAWNRLGRVQGWTNTRLTVRGREQARRAGVALDSESVDRLLASDLARATVTGRLVRSRGVDAPLERTSEWRERDFGDHQGQTREEIASKHPDFEPDRSLTAVESVPGGESRTEFRERVENAFGSVFETLGDGETAVVVTHGGPIRVAVADAQGRSLRAVAMEWSPENCGRTTLTRESGELTVEQRDDVA